MANPKRVLNNLSALGELEEYEYLGKSYSDIKHDLETSSLDQIFSLYSYEALSERLLPQIRPLNSELIETAILFRQKLTTDVNTSRKVEPEFAMISDEQFDEDHYKQLDLQLRDKEEITPYTEAIQRIAVASELAFELICKRHELKVERLNANGDYFASEDFIVDDTRVDVKAKCHIGSKSKKYEKQLKDNASHEVMAIFYSLKDFDEDQNTFCCLLGIMDFKQLKKYNLNKLSLNYINPCLLIDFKEYFKLSKKHSLLKETVSHELLDFYLQKNKVSDYPTLNVSAACQHFGFHQVMTYLAQHDYFDADFVQLFNELAVPNYEFDDSIIKTYNWLIRMIKKKKLFNIILFQRTVMRALVLTPQQVEYLGALLKVINYLPKFRCKFSGASIHECEISISNDFIIARKDFKSPGNTLFARSWYDHSILVLGDADHEQCDAENCGCLTHKVRDIRVGRLHCKKYGRDSFHTQNKKKKQEKLRNDE